MRCLTNSEASEWLVANGVPQNPYQGGNVPRLYLQFYPPTDYRRIDSFMRHYFERIIPGAEAMIHMTDWGLYLPSEMIAITGIRKSFSEDRWLIDAPGHLIFPTDVEVGVSLFALSTSFAWKSYLYSPIARSTIYNWEGEIFDFWTDSDEAFGAMCSLLGKSGLTETNKVEKAGSSDSGKLPD